MPAKPKQTDEQVEFHNSILNGIRSLEQMAANLEEIGRHLESIDDSLKTMRDVYIDQTGYHRPTLSEPAQRYFGGIPENKHKVF